MIRKCPILILRRFVGVEVVPVNVLRVDQQLPPSSSRGRARLEGVEGARCDLRAAAVSLGQIGSMSSSCLCWSIRGVSVAECSIASAGRGRSLGHSSLLM